jgi:hypothetical protein
LEFAKRIKLPTGHLHNSEHAEAIMELDPLEELEKDQSRFKGYVEELKARLMS